MSTTAPTAIPPATQPAPDRGDRVTFNARAVYLVNYWRDTMVPGVNAATANVYANAVDAFASANTALSARDSASGFASQASGYKDSASNSASVASGFASQASGYKDTALSARDASVAAKDLSQAAKTDAETARNGAQSAQTAAETARNQAVSAAAFAYSGNSTTSSTVALGPKTFIIEPSKSFTSTQYVSVTKRTDTSVRMSGYVTGYNSTTGALDVSVTSMASPGTTNADWVVALSADGGAAGVQAIAAGTYTDADLTPLNSVTVITGVNSAYATTHLPVLHANSASGGWSTSYDWVVETIGFGTGAGLDATQTAVCSVVGNLVGAGLRFVRKKMGTTWGRWKPVGTLPTSTLTVSGGDMYGDTQLGNNRINHVATALNGAAGVWFFPASPEDGDRFAVYTNSRSDNALFWKDKPIIGNGISLTVSNDNVKLNKPFSRFGFFYNLYNDSWMIE